ncbi:hypothetical protein KY363_06210 [Candidatus Woesearchaeota archaeon]|nr:hypothetical protein [Candidatus Woesearchaeota archaeon]
MNWTKLLYVLMIVLLYIPMVFLGANVFFPEYTGQDSYYNYRDCIYPAPVVSGNMTAEDKAAMDASTKSYTECNDKNREAERQWNSKKNAYEGWKYVYIALFNLAVLLLALFVTMQDSIVMGLFLASISSTFGSTMRYFDSRSKIGFIVLVVIFFTMVYFINRKKDTIVDWKTRDQPKKK